ncbi:MAG TPA: VCBS repeat-containing protein, partial [Bryobacteraceae bacterium]|nr:VCBS repeat-containing protein [Bryobacteraceae bacterium]
MRSTILLAVLLCSVVAAAVTQPKFFARRDYGAPALPEGSILEVQVADVNGDGIPDVIVIPSLVIGTLLGKGDGTFRPGPSSNTGWVSSGVVFNVPADLNGDGIIDLVITGGGNGGLGICFGNGDGSFQAAVNLSIADGIYNAVVGDFNGDGIPDILASGGKGLWLLTGKGGGLFNPGVLTPLANIYGTVLA